MTLSQDSRQHFEVIARDTLEQFEKVAEAARSALRDTSPPGADALATVNTLTSTNAIQSLAQIGRATRESYQQLANEPAIARVVVVDDGGRQSTYYICRATPMLGMASYRSPVGRLASLPVGESLALPERTVEVLERAQLHPAFVDQSWDSSETVLEGDDYGPVTIESLRVLLKSVAEEDLVERLLAEESDSANLLERIRRTVIAKMGLRDQPILDQYQDAIFRLPLDSRLLILGPPGTGKTTTLIRRLGQKLDLAFLEEDERLIVESTSVSDAPPHAQSWLMFTPTELLKQYVKEAFAREGIPASDQRIRTWSDYRRELARNVLGVLRTGSGGGAFVLKESLESIAAETQDSAIGWFTDFYESQKTRYVSEIRMAAQKLSEDPEPKIGEIGQRLFSIVQRMGSGALVTLFTTLNAEVKGIQAVLAGMKEITDKRLRDELNLQLNRNKNFLDELAAFMDSVQETAAETDEDEDQDSDDEEETGQPKTARAAALAAYLRAVRAQARAQARKRSLRKATRNGKIVDWLGERTLGASGRAEVGASLLVQAGARQFVNPVKRYIGGIPRRYRAFRRLRQGEGKWYRKEGFNPTDIHPLELDVVLLAILRGAGELLAVPAIVRELDAPVWSSLRPIHDLYKNQILVDEATDFSPVQIASMAALANPRIRSFFACGDFNQRLTTWGSRSIDEMKWVFPAIEIKTITVSYRQSRQLSELAKAIVRAAGGTDGGVTLPEHVDNEGVPPVLAEGKAQRPEIVHWLAQRIVEIESFAQQLPSIAILVNSEETVQWVAEDLNKALSNQNIRVVACPNGQVMGQDNDVRVFDVQHIKGLEFEAVFFIGIDELASMHPGLFDKYLYVGSTRAATYLGVTCDGELPPTLATVRPMFASNWANA